jgi:hypothetical protein
MHRLRLAVLLAGLALVAFACGCARAVVMAPPLKPDASVTAQSGKLVVSIHVDPVRASVGELITATVSIRNISAHHYRLVEGTLAFMVRVTDASSTVVFDSADAYRGMKMPLFTMKLAPGATTSGRITFRLNAPGNYDAVAYSTNNPQLKTPPVRVVVSAL